MLLTFCAPWEMLCLQWDHIMIVNFRRFKPCVEHLHVSNRLGYCLYDGRHDKVLWQSATHKFIIWLDSFRSSVSGCFSSMCWQGAGVYLVGLTGISACSQYVLIAFSQFSQDVLRVRMITTLSGIWTCWMVIMLEPFDSCYAIVMLVGFCLSFHASCIMAPPPRSHGILEWMLSDKTQHTTCAGSY